MATGITSKALAAPIRHGLKMAAIGTISVSYTHLHPDMLSILFNGAQSVGAGIAACKNMRVREEEGLDAASKDAEGTFKTFS